MILTVHGGCIQGSPSICMGRAFIVLEKKKSHLITLHHLHSAGGLRPCECGYTKITFAIFTMLGTYDATIHSKSGAADVGFPSLCVFILCVIAWHRMNCVVFFLCILTWWWFEKSEPVCARRSSAPCRSVPSRWPLPTPPPPGACRLYLWSDVTRRSDTGQSQTRRAKTSRDLSGSHLVRLFWDVQGPWGPHPGPPLMNYRVSWIHPRGWSHRACWVCWGQLCPPKTCCRGPGVSRNTGPKQSKNVKTTFSELKKITPLASDLNHQTVLQLFAGGKDGLRGGELKIPKFVLHSEMTRRKWIVSKRS